MGFFESLIKEANDNVEWNEKSEYFIFPVQRAYIKVKSKYRGLKGRIFCVRCADEYTWYASRRSYRKAMDELAYTIGDYLVIDDDRARIIKIKQKKEGTIK